MNNDFKSINQIYKPYKYTIKNNVIILNCQNEDIVLKKKDDKLLKLQYYMSSRNFNNFVKIKDINRDKHFIYPFIYENNIPYEQKACDMAKVVALLHAKTSYYKEIDKNNYDQIYLNIENNIMHAKEYYSKLYDDIFIKIDYNPCEMIFMDIYSKINNACNFCKSELDNWFNIVTDKKTSRVVLLHNNLKLDHFIKGEEDYLISFEKAKTDTPVIDLVKFYKNEYNNINFSLVLKNYLYHYDLTEDEYKLFFILISIPDIVDVSNNTKKNFIDICSLKNYLNKTEELIRPYYSKNDEEE